jgi:hypothetical protein
MNLFLTHTGDAAREGIGAATQYILFTYASSRNLNLKFKFNGFSNVDQYQFHPEYDINTWADKFNRFFNFPDDSIPFDHQNIQLNNIPEVEDYIKNNLINTPTVVTLKSKNNGLLNINPEPLKQYFWELTERINHDTILDENTYNISLHIRSFNACDTDPNPGRQYYSDDKKTFYINLINKILQIPTDKPKKFYLHTQIGEENFSYLKDLNCDYTVLNNTYPWISLSYMIQSDLLVGANSSFSYIAHLLSKNKSIFRNDFWHTLYADTILVDTQGNF